jgi:transposase
MEDSTAALTRIIKDQQSLLERLSSELRAEREARRKEHEQDQALIRSLQAQVAWFQRQLFGRKSEKHAVSDPNWPTFFDEEFSKKDPEVENAGLEASEEIERVTVRDRRQARRNRKMMENLPVLEREYIDPEGIDLSVYRKIGEEVTRIVEHVPGKLYIKEIIRNKYGLRDNTIVPGGGKPGVLIAPMPKLPVYKGIAGASLLSEMLLQKYQYHVPFYRQVQQMRHLGLSLTESTVDGWFMPAVSLLEPLYGVLKDEILHSDYIQSDETTVPVMGKKDHRASKEYLWMVRAVVERLVLFHYDKGSRAGRVIQELAKNFHGYLQCDGFEGYESAFKTNSNVCLVNCMAHIRRHFEAALDENREAAGHAIGEIGKLYKVERLCDENGLSAGERKAKRQKLSRPIMESLRQWMETDCLACSPQSLMGKAVTYAYTRWDNMMHYLDDGRIMIDNNLAENAIRPITLGRKNYLFCGNEKAASAMSVVCSLLATCKAHNVNPRLYLNDVIARMPYLKEAPKEKLAELLPHKWKLSHKEAVLDCGN